MAALIFMVYLYFIFYLKIPFQTSLLSTTKNATAQTLRTSFSSKYVHVKVFWQLPPSGTENYLLVSYNYIPAKFGVYSIVDGDSNRVTYQSFLSV